MVFRAGALLLVVGLGLRLFMVPGACWVVAIGVVMFGAMQLLAGYEGRDLVITRLRRQQIFSVFVFLGMAVLMILQDQNMGYAWAQGNVWQVCLFIAVLLQGFTAFRIPQELERSKKKEAQK